MGTAARGALSFPAISHLTLTSGHLRLSPREEVGADVIARFRPIIRTGAGRIAGLVITLDPPERPGGRIYRLGWGPVAAVRAVLCWSGSPEIAAAWWVEALGVEPVATGVVAPPVPWLAVAMLPAAMGLAPEQLGMLGDAERCVAWALLDGAQNG